MVISGLVVNEGKILQNKQRGISSIVFSSTQWQARKPIENK